MTSFRACLLLWATLLHQAAAQSFYQDSFFVDFDYNASSSVGPSNWDTIDTSSSEWVQYDEGHPTFDLGIPGDGEASASMCGGLNGPFPNDRDSPLYLAPRDTCEDTHEMLTRQISRDDCTQDDLTFFITPHALRAYMPLDDDSCTRPTINLSGFADDFILVWMELHARAEHVVDGKRYDAELQMAHMGTNDANYMMATVSVLIDASARREHEEFQFLLDGWQQAANNKKDSCNARFQNDDHVHKKKKMRQAIQEQDENSSHVRRRLLVNETSPCKSDRFGGGCEPRGPRRKMYPYNMWPSIYYYGYRGSLTTPPCADIVNWRILDEPLKISKRQYRQLTNLLKASTNDNCQADTRVSPQGENFRPLQPYNGERQSLFHCKYDDFSFWMYQPKDQ